MEVASSLEHMELNLLPVMARALDLDVLIIIVHIIVLIATCKCNSLYIFYHN